MLGVEPEEFTQLLAITFEDIQSALAVPAANERQCGWGAHHSLKGAQEATARFLAARDSWNQIYR